MQAAILKSTSDVNRLIEQLRQQKQVREGKYDWMDKKIVDIKLETATKSPGRGEKLDTTG